MKSRFYSIFLILMTFIVLNGCMEKRPIILVAEQAEAEMVARYIPGAECICTGVGASNVINACSRIPKGSKVVNIGYAGSNCLEVGTVAAVGRSYRLTDGNYQFDDFRNPLVFKAETDGSGDVFPCYTSNSFVTQTDITEAALFDMELNYIVAFPFEMLGSIKIVSDNLSVDAFLNNALRESGVLTSEDVWTKVAEKYISLCR